jgi:hypothetical protein
MCESDPIPEASSSSSWAELLADLVRGFILLRDLFGYVLPGALFLMIGAQSGHLSAFGDLSKFPIAESHTWLLALVLLLISYLLGHFILATFYFIPDVSHLIDRAVRKGTGLIQRVAHKMLTRDNRGKTQHQEPLAVEEKPNDVETSKFLRFRTEFPDIFIEYDRQSILALLRRGLAASLFLGLLVFYRLYTHPLRVMVVAGAIMLINSLSGYFHIEELKMRTLKAAEEAAEAQTSSKSH